MKKMWAILAILVCFIAADTNESVGAKLYTKHGCYGCHGINAKGTNNFPKLAGKSKSYLKKRLLGYKNGNLHSNRANMMAPFAKALSDKEIEEIASFLHSLGKKKLFDEERYFQDYEIGTSSGS